MTERMFFAYEKDFAGRYCPVVYYNEKPSKRMEGEPVRSAVYDVPPECIGGDGEPMFSRLVKRFPPPQEKEDEAESS